MKAAALIAVLLASVCAFSSAVADNTSPHQFDHSNVLGSSLRININASNVQALAAQKAVLETSKQLQSIFSSFDSESELSRLNASKQAFKLSLPMRDIITLCEQWRETLPKGFSCRLGQVIAKWHSFQDTQQRPLRKNIRALARAAATSPLSLTSLLEGKPNDSFDWAVGGIAKGHIIDEALQAARVAAPDAHAIAIDIGGDSIYWQRDTHSKPWKVKVATPGKIDDSGDSFLGTLTLRSGAIAYSGPSNRGLVIKGKKYDNHFTPRDGWPSAAPLSAVVYADRASSADAIATALTIMSIPDALDWVNQQANVETLLISNDGRQHRSDGWDKLYQSNNQQHNAVAEISFALPRINNGDYRRPYVALWIQNKDRKVVKNLLLLGDNARWMRKNRLWWRQQGRQEELVLTNIARPTRKAGEYQIIWDGRDDFGKTIYAGHYTLVLEAAREHGGHEKINIDFDVNSIKTVQQVKGKTELSFLKIGPTITP